MSDEGPPPSIFVQWYHAGPAELLSSAPVSLGTTVAWQTLTRAESIACEGAWNSLSDEERRLANEYIEEEKDVPLVDEDSEDERDFLGVPVTLDKLFEVDVRTMRLYPVFWKTPGPPIKVRRCVWMYDETRAVEPVLSRELEEAYHTVHPWYSSYPDEVQAALTIGTLEAQDKLKTRLPKSDHSVVFQDACTARVFEGTTPPSTGIFRFLFGGARSGELFPGATVVYRGVENAVGGANVNGEAKGKENGVVGVGVGAGTGDGRRMSVTSLEESTAKRQKLDVSADASRTRRSGVHPDISRPDSRASSTKSEGATPKGFMRPVAPGRKKTTLEVEVENVLPRSEDTVVTDLVLVIHGIGQGYTAQYEAWDFTYATNLFRDIARKQSQSPALASIMRSRRAQFIPVPWRASMKLGFDEELERSRDGLDNRFTLSVGSGRLMGVVAWLDITPKKTIPLLDETPNEKQSTPGQDDRIAFLEKHILAHSLGSALSAHVLSAQPTKQRKLDSFTPEELSGMSRQFLFDTSHLFLIGSPLGVFMHINQAQLIARKGRERTMNAQPDEALDRTGLFGCLAIDAIYNIFNASDPIAYLLNPCVDSQHAKSMSQVTIPSVGTTVLTTIGSRVARIFDGVTFPMSSPVSRSSSPGPRAKAAAKAKAWAEREDSVAPGEMMDLGETDETRKGDSRAERRFRALNPHGNIDYALPSEGAISDYVDMITAHGDYWSDPNLASFVLTEIFASKEDLLRTGIGMKA
ncbi:hypothetical protein FRC09_012073 [Ceratobasidium sp. 395]|nr:hypothetical protein FRC09_012073 [Ceratobasidium sp. 395]